MSNTTEPKSWFARLKEGLTKTSNRLSDGIGAIFTKRKLDRAMLEELEELLIGADVGAQAAAEIVVAFGKERFDKEIGAEEVKEALAAEIAVRLAPVAKPMAFDAAYKPFVVMVVGVNGNGKTTTAGKLAAAWKAEGKKVMLAAADTFRAAAVEQLKIWGERAGVTVYAGAHEADPASIAYQALEKARADGVDILLIDTAGRLHNKQNLMAELQKILRVLQKLDDTAPHAVLQILDATTGQNAIAQVEAFQSMVKVTGLAVTKLDGTAKAGIVVALAQKFALPVHAVGVGEGVADLRSFSANEFAENLVGLGVKA